ncbi:MAG: hypothetical protein ACOC85_02105 [Thermoplasmatota archaeon]
MDEEELEDEKKKRREKIPPSPFSKRFGILYEWGAPLGLTFLLITGFTVPIGFILYLFLDWIYLLLINLIMFLVGSPLALYGKLKGRNIEKKVKYKQKMLEEYQEWLQNMIDDIL